MKEGNSVVFQTGMHGLMLPLKQRWRIETDYTVSRDFRFVGRMEFVWIRNPRAALQRGFLGMAGFAFSRSGLSVNIGCSLFLRLLIMIPGFIPLSRTCYIIFPYRLIMGRGLHYYINLHRDFSRLIPHGGKHFSLSGWIKWGQIFYPGAGNSLAPGWMKFPVTGNGNKIAGFGSMAIGISYLEGMSYFC